MRKQYLLTELMALITVQVGHFQLSQVMWRACAVFHCERPSARPAFWVDVNVQKSTLSESHVVVDCRLERIVAVHVSSFNQRSVARTHTHTHTHTQRERERERSFCFKCKLVTVCFPPGFLLQIVSSANQCFIFFALFLLFHSCTVVSTAFFM